MRGVLLIGWMLFALGLQGQSHAELKSRFWKQIQGTCSGTLRFEKTVTDLTGSDSPEQKTYRIDCRSGLIEAPQDSPFPFQEFDYLFEQDFDNPYLSPLMNFERSPSLVSATLKPEEAGESALQNARFELSGTNITLASASVRKSSPLYELEVDIEVRFDAQGRYLSHLIKTRSDLLLGSEVKTQIQGRLIP
jgi:hypothetical protein